MKNRIISLFAILAIVLSAFVLAGCPAKENGDESGDESNPVVLTTKETFKSGFDFGKLSTAPDGFFPVMPMAQEFDLSGSYGFDMELDFSKLVISGADVLGGEKTSLAFDGKSNLSSMAFQASAAINAFGDSLKLNSLSDGKVMFFEIEDVTEKFIKLDFSTLADELGEISGTDTTVATVPSFDDASKALTLIKKYISFVWDSIDDDKFVKEEKDGATSIKLELSAADINDIIDKLKAELKADEELKAIAGDTSDVDYDGEIDELFETQPITSVSAAVTLVNDKLDDFDIEIVIDNDGTSEKVSFSYSTAVTDKKTEKQMALTYNTQTLIDVKTVYDATDKKKIAVTAEINDNDGVKIASSEVTLEETEEGKFVGDMSVTVEMGEETTEISCSLAASYTESKLVYTISDFSFKSSSTSNMAVTLPITLTISFEQEDKKSKYELSFSVAIPQIAEVEGKLAFSVEKIDDFTATLPTDSTDAKDVDGDALIQKLSTKCHNIVAALSGLSGGDQPIVGATTIADSNGDGFSFYMTPSESNDGFSYGRLYYAFGIVEATDTKMVINLIDGSKYTLNLSDVSEKFDEYGYADITVNGDVWQYWSDDTGLGFVTDFAVDGDVLSTSIQYFSEDNYGVITCDMLYSIDDDSITFIFPDGSEKTLSYENAAGIYKIGGKEYTEYTEQQ